MKWKAVSNNKSKLDRRISRVPQPFLLLSICTWLSLAPCADIEWSPAGQGDSDMRAPLCQTWSSKPLDQGNSYNNNSTPKTWKGRVDKSFCWDTAWFAWGITLSSQGVSAVVIVSWHLLASVHSTAWLSGFPRSLMCVQSSMILMGQCISSYSKVINVGSSVAGSFWETCQILKMTSSSYFYCTKIVQLDIYHHAASDPVSE